MGAQVGRLGISAEHEALHDAARGWCQRHVPRDVPRACLDGGTADLHALWSAMVDQGWTTLPADFGLGGLIARDIAATHIPDFPLGPT